MGGPGNSVPKSALPVPVARKTGFPADSGCAFPSADVVGRGCDEAACPTLVVVVLGGVGVLLCSEDGESS